MANQTLPRERKVYETKSKSPVQAVKRNRRVDPRLVAVLQSPDGRRVRLLRHAWDTTEYKHDGRTHYHLNAMVPVDATGKMMIASPDDMTCPRCGYSYSHRNHSVAPSRVCDECRIELYQHKAAYYQRVLGIQLGCTHGGFDPAEQRKEWNFDYKRSRERALPHDASPTPNLKRDRKRNGELFHYG